MPKNNRRDELGGTDVHRLENCYGNHVGGFILLPDYRDAVVHLVGDAIDPTDNIYLDLRFTGWTSAGGFSYQRAGNAITPPMATGDYNENGLVDAADYVSGAEHSAKWSLRSAAVPMAI